MQSGSHEGETELDWKCRLPNLSLSFLLYHFLLTHLPLLLKPDCLIRLLHLLFIIPPPLCPLTLHVYGLVRGLTLCGFRLPSFHSVTQAKLHILSTSVLLSKGWNLDWKRSGQRTGGKQKKRDEMESDIAEEAEEGGAEIKLNTNWQRDEELWIDKKRRPEGWNTETKPDRLTDTGDRLQRI